MPSTLNMSARVQTRNFRNASIACAAAALALVGAPSARASQVLTYHNSNTRHGVYVVPGLTPTTAASVTPDTAFNGTISGNVYAQPLFWRPSVSDVGEVIAATENNIVYALNEKTGAVIWQRQLPAAATSGFSCGGISPAGITGTPVIDPSTGTLYLNSETLENGAAQHEIYALSLKDGSIVSGWPVNTQAALKGAGVNFTPAQQGSRSALLFFNGNLYVSYGGRDGDCQPYHGTVVQIDPTSRALAGHWQTSAVGGGIWAQGGASSDGNYLFATTGNTFNANNVWGGGEAIVRFRAGLAAPTATTNYYAPANWQALDNGDTDLGGTEAIPLGVTNGTGGVSQRLIALGKDGNAYLVNLLNLGGIGGPATIAHLSNTVILTAPAVYESSNSTLLAFTNWSGAQSQCSGNTIQMLNLQSTGSNPISVAWCSAFSGRGSPMITVSTGNSNPIVWVVGAEGDNLLHGFNALTGATVYKGATAMQGLRHFQTLIAADGRLYVGADNKIYAYTFTP